MRRLYQHRREILRASWFYANTNANGDGHAHGDRNANGHTDRNADAVHREMRTNAKAAPDARAQAVGLKPNDEIRMSNDELTAYDK